AAVRANRAHPAKALAPCERVAAAGAEVGGSFSAHRRRRAAWVMAKRPNASTPSTINTSPTISGLAPGSRLTGAGTGVGVKVGVRLGVAVSVAVDVGVSVGVAVLVAVAVGVAVSVGVSVAVAVGLASCAMAACGCSAISPSASSADSALGGA